MLTSTGLGDAAVQVHQSNYRRLQELRAASSSLDAQIKDTLRLLANTRKELVATPATVFPEDRPYYDIKYDELLSYARTISKTTIPPAGVSSVPVSETQGNPPDVAVTETAATTPGASAAPTPNGVQSNETQQGQSTDPDASQAATPAASGPAGLAGGNANANTTLPEQMAAHLNPHLQIEFTPWPTEDGVRGGSLAALAFLAERGINPEGYDPEERARREREEEEQRRAREESEERARKAREEQQAARLHAERERQRALREQEQQAADEEAHRRGSTGAGPSAPGATASSPVAGERKQFQFITSFDDDDD